MPYDNIESHKKTEFHLSLEDTFFENHKGVKLTPPPAAILGLKFYLHFLSFRRMCVLYNYFSNHAAFTIKLKEHDEKFKYFENKKSFQDEIRRAFFITFKRLSLKQIKPFLIGK